MLQKAKFDQAWRDTLWIFGISRLVLILITFLAVSRIPALGQSPQQFIAPYDCAHHLRQCLKAWYKWDTQHYVYIAQYGYIHSAQNGDASRTAFFPLWPLLMRAVARPFGQSTMVYYMGGVIL